METLLTPVFWPGEFQGLYSPWGRKESDMTEHLSCGHRTRHWAFSTPPPGDSNAHTSVRTHEPSSDADTQADAMRSGPPMAPRLRDLPQLSPRARQLNLGICTPLTFQNLLFCNSCFNGGRFLCHALLFSKCFLIPLIFLPTKANLRKHELHVRKHQETVTNRQAWRAIAHGVSKSRTWLSD